MEIKHSGWGALALSILAIVATLDLVGCGASDEVSAPVLEKPIDSALQDKAKQSVVDLVAALKAKRTSEVVNMLQPDARVKAAILMNEPSYRTLVEGKDWSYDSVQGGNRGKEVVVRARFMGTNAKQYRTNIVFGVKGQQLLIKNVLVPTFPNTPTAIGGSVSSLK